MTPDQTPQTWIDKLPGNKKGLFIGAGIAAGLIVVGLCSWFAYALWYQSPEKIITDAIANAMMSRTVAIKGTVSSSASDGRYTYGIDAQGGFEEGFGGTLEVDGKAPNTTKNIDVTFEGVQTINGDAYVKATHLDNVYDQLLGGLVETTSKDPKVQQQVSGILGALLKPVLAKVEGKWVRFVADDIKRYDAKTGDEYACVERTLRNLSDKPDVLQELGARYYKNTFLVIKKSLETSGQTMKYVMELDSNRTQKYIDSLKSTKLYKEFQVCSPKGKNPLDVKNAEWKNLPKTIQFELWINQSDRQITRIRTLPEGIKIGEAKHAFDISTSFNKPVKVTVPRDAMSVDEAIPSLSEILGGTSATSGTMPSFLKDLI